MNKTLSMSAVVATHPRHDISGREVAVQAGWPDLQARAPPKSSSACVEVRLQLQLERAQCVHANVEGQAQRGVRRSVLHY